MGNRKYRYVVLGTGMGECIAHWLLGQPDTEWVTITDLDYEKAKKIANQLREMTQSQCWSTQFNTAWMQELKILEYCDVVISALPAKCNLPIVKAAIANNVHYVDLGGVLEVTKNIFALKENHPINVSVVPDCGVMPGLGMILAKKLIYLLGQVDNLKIVVGGMPQKPTPPLFYQGVYSIEGLKHICFDDVFIIRDGQIMATPPFSDYSQVLVSALSRFSPRGRGEIEIFNTAGSSLTPWIFKKLGVKNFSEQTARWPGFVNFIKDIPPHKFEEKIKPYIATPVTTDNPDLVWMKIEASNQSGLRTFEMLDLFDNKTGFTAMQRTTGISAAIIAAKAARKKLKRGIFTPDEALSKYQLDQYITEVKKYFTINEG